MSLGSDLDLLTQFDLSLLSLQQGQQAVGGQRVEWQHSNLVVPGGVAEFTHVGELGLL